MSLTGAPGAAEPAAVESDQCRCGCNQTDSPDILNPEIPLGIALHPLFLSFGLFQIYDLVLALFASLCVSFFLFKELESTHFPALVDILLFVSLSSRSHPQAYLLCNQHQSLFSLINFSL
jgi:hypothetical protein